MQIQNLRNKAVFLALVLLVAACFILRASDRNQHFQECDSSFVYDTVADFPNAAMLFAAGTFRNQETSLKMSREMATRIVESPLVAALLNVALKNYPRDQLIKALSSGDKSPLFFVRGALIAGLMSANNYIPHSVKVGFALSLASTYSFGHGLIYGLVTSSDTSYEIFMDRGMLITLALFHASIIGLYFLLRRSGVSALSSALAASIGLFSLSLSSYSYHLGSTIWNFAVGVFFLWAAVQSHRKSEEKYLQSISWLAGILVFFNYLIVFLWLALMLEKLFSVHGEFSALSYKKKILKLLKTQWAALLLFLVNVLLFFPGGQSRGGQVASLSEFASNVYYIFLNVFSAYNHSHYLDVFQFAVYAVLTLVGVFYCAKLWRSSAASFLPRLLLILFVMVFGLLILGAFGLGPSFGPSRHILFAAPVLLMLVAVGVDALAKRLRNGDPWLAFSLGLVVCFGLFGAHTRQQDVQDHTASIRVDSSVKHVLIEGCHYHLLHKKWGAAKTVQFNNPAAPSPLEKGATYLYISQDIQNPMRANMQQWRQQGFSLKEKDSQVLTTGVQFLAYSPKLYPWDRQSGFEAISFSVEEK